MKNSVLFGMAAALLLVASCTPKLSGIRTEKCQFSDEGAHARLSIEAELPVAATEGTAVMRQTLVDMMDRALTHIGYGEEGRAFPRFDGDIDDAGALGTYYGGKAFADLAAKSQADVDLRTADIEANGALTDEERAHALAEIPGWEFDFKLKKVYETDRIAVFDAIEYIYLGGAHGGVGGDGALTFDKESGMRIRDFFVPGAAAEMQDLLRRGLTEYFAEASGGTEYNVEDFLHLDGELIPLPAWAPMPMKSGLVLTYQQYEIAAYAAGMPSFTLSYKDAEPFLLPETKADLGL
ncbi:MAG: DUF3298 domain-containing protein [Bacteroidales bacterium]|nr:DUF3298 domain-containing protein [Bacteroidales bacterium]